MALGSNKFFDADAQGFKRVELMATLAHDEGLVVRPLLKLLA